MTRGGELQELVIAIKGAGEMASAVAWRLYMAGLRTIFMMEIAAEVVVGVTMCTLLFFYAVRQTFGLGQMNGLLVFLMVMAALALKQRDTASGVFVTFAASLKISPLILLGFFIARRRWRALIGTVIAGARVAGSDVDLYRLEYLRLFCDAGAAGSRTWQRSLSESKSVRRVLSP